MQQPPTSSSLNPNAGGGGPSPGPGALGTSPLHSVNSPVGYHQQQQQQQQQTIFGLGQQSSPHHVMGQQQQHSNVQQTQQVANGHHHHQMHQTQQHHHQQHAHSPLMVSGGGGSMMGGSILEDVFLSEHTDDDNDVFQCGKCKSTFCRLQLFMSHKKCCSTSLLGHPKSGSPHHQSSLSSSVMSHLHPAHHHLVQQHQQLTTNLDLDLDQLMMSQAQSQGPLSSGPMMSQESPVSHHHQHQHHQHHHHVIHHPRQASPTLTEVIGGHSSVNSILSETDLLSLTPSLDAQMMVSIGHSISPSSLLHLQGGDVSANTDDFAQFRLTPTPTQSPQPSQQMSTDQSLDYHGIPPNVELHHQGNSLGHRSQSPPQSPHLLTAVNSFMNTLQNTSPTSFASLIQGLSSGGTDSSMPVSVPSSSSASNSLLPGAEMDATSNDNSNSIGSPSRFLNLPPPRTPSGSQSSSQSTLLSSTSGAEPSTPLRPSSLPSIVEHHPHHGPITNHHQLQQQQQHSQTPLTVIHHHPSHLSPRPQPPVHVQAQSLIIKDELEEEFKQVPLSALVSGSSKVVPPNVTLEKKFHEPPLVSASTHSATPVIKAESKMQTKSQQKQPLTNVNCFPCNYCDRSFPKNTDLLNHMPCHTGEKPFQCLHCGKAFSQKSNLRKHIQTHKISRDEMRVIYKNSLEAMANTKTIVVGLSSDKSPPTEVTKKGTQKSANGFHGSTSQVKKETLAQSIQQLDVASSDLGLSGSQDSSSPNKYQTDGPLEMDAYTCPLDGCEYWSTNEDELRTHFTDTHVKVPVHEDGTRQTSNLVFKCVRESCDELLVDVDAFLKHLRTHKEHSKLSDATVATVSTVIKAKGANENEKPKPGKQRSYRCNTCLNRYTTEEALQQHQTTSTHHFPCTKCDKVFPCERYLRRHLLTHGAVLYSCKYCDKSFKTANYLKVHLVIHTGEKPFTCATCDAAFNRRDKLKRHELVHDPVKRYKCPLSVNGCTREFNRPDKLKAHILTHSGVKPYQCSLCKRSFTRRAHLREHFKMHDPTVVTSLGYTMPTLDDSPMSSDPVKAMKDASLLSASETLTKLAKAKSSGSGTLKRSRTISSSDEINPTTEEDDEDEDDDEDDSSDDVMLIESSDKEYSKPATSVTKTEMNPTATPRPAAPAASAASAPSTASASQAASNFILVRNVNNNANPTTQPALTNSTQSSSTMVMTGMDPINFLAPGNFMLVFSCPRCEQLFIKEAEMKTHAAKCSAPLRNTNQTGGTGRSNVMLIGTQPQTRPLGPSTT